MELVWRFLVLGQGVDHVLERQEHPGVDLEGQMQIEGSPAPVLRVQLDLPGLAQAVGLDEMSLVVDVEAVIDGVVLDLGDEPGDVDDSMC